MSNDLSTLSGALLEMKDELIYQLGQKGVTASYSSTDGLLGLIGKISEIEQGGSCYKVTFDNASYTTTGSLTVSVTVLKNYSACVDETVTFTSSTSTTTTATTDSNGVATVTISFSGSTILTASIGGATDTATVTVQSYLFFDNCSVDNTQQYTLTQIKGNANATLTFNAQEQAYLVHGTSTERAIYTFGDTTLQNGIKISADIKLGGANWYCNGMLGWFDPNNPQNNYVGGFAQGETYYRLMEFVNNVEATTPNNRWSGLSTSDYNHHELTYNNGIFDYTITNPQGVSKTVTLNQRMDWVGSKIGLFIETNRYDLCYVKNIVVEAL